MKMTGIVTAYNTSRGFGFILTGKNQIFFHVCDWGSVEQPVKGIIVSYDVAPANNRKFQHQAVAVEIITAEQAAQFAAAASAELLQGYRAGIQTDPAANQEAK